MKTFLSYRSMRDRLSLHVVCISFHYCQEGLKDIDFKGSL